MDNQTTGYSVSAQNDEFRRHVCLGSPYPDHMPRLEGKLVCTAAVAAKGMLFVDTCRRAVGFFAEFSQDNDPHGHHDFGSISIGETKVLWKIDAYDRDYDYGSEDPSDPAQTARVLTILFPADW